MSAATKSTAALYDTAIRHLDDVIKTIEDIPVTRLPNEHMRTAARLLTEAYDLRHGLTAASDTVTWG